MGEDPLQGPLGGGGEWALKIETFLGPKMATDEF